MVACLAKEGVYAAVVRLLCMLRRALAPGSPWAPAASSWLCLFSLSLVERPDNYNLVNANLERKTPAMPAQGQGAWIMKRLSSSCFAMCIKNLGRTPKETSDVPLMQAPRNLRLAQLGLMQQI